MKRNQHRRNTTLDLVNLASMGAAILFGLIAIITLIVTLVTGGTIGGLFIAFLALFLVSIAAVLVSKKLKTDEQKRADEAKEPSSNAGRHRA
jgi:membrane protein implicated in regulation of membrane protease activity